MKKIRFHTIIISDIHFGQPNCQSRELFGFLGSLRVDTLILNGDVFNDINFFRLKHWDWESFSQLRKISDHCRVVWNQGNHDLIDARFMSALLGVRVHEGYGWTYRGKPMYAVHGHKWDTYIYRYRTSTAVLTWIYDAIQRLSGRWSRKIASWIKERSKAMMRNSEMIRKNALATAGRRGIKFICCGHTHKAELVERGGVIYANCGTWESDVPHFIGIDEKGVHLCRYRGEKAREEGFFPLG